MSEGRAEDWSLITVSYNSAEHLRRCWTGVDLGGAEWIVVDNASGDDSASVAAALGARVIQLPKNVGFAAANNVAVATVTREWVAFVNPDVTIAGAEDLERLAATSALNGSLVAPQLLNPDGTEQPNGRGIPFLADKVAHRLGSFPGANLDDYSRTGLARPTYVAWVIGAALAGPTRTFRDLGGWDERFFVYYEDHEIGLRAWANGVPVVLDPAVRWMHRWQRATTRPALRPWRNELQAGNAFYRKHPGLLVRRGPWTATRREAWLHHLDSLLWSSAKSPGDEERPIRRVQPGIVVPLFRPDDYVVKRLTAMAAQAPVFAVDDGSPKEFEQVLRQVADLPCVTLVRRSRNSGIAAALNDGVEVARRAGTTPLFTFDQDSSPAHDHVERLVEVLDDYGSRVGAVGAGTVAGAPLRPGLERHHRPVKVRSLYQSGMAIPVETFDRIGGFDESLFIDGVDTDFCLRVGRAGLQVLADPRVHLEHQWGVGAKRFRVGPFWPAATRHGSQRRYYMNRNAVRLLRRHGSGAPWFALAEFRHLAVGNALALLTGPRRIAQLAAVLQGWSHGFAGVTGARPSGGLRAGGARRARVTFEATGK